VIRDVVEGAGAGVAVPPGDPQALAEAVRSLAADPAQARRMGERGRTCVEKRFDRRDLARQLEQVLLEASRR
jgi:glycosyltransferase involved in cell wall biosynthesis